MSIYDVVKAHCIVQAGLNVSGSVRSGSVKVRNAYYDWFYAAFEIWSYWCYKNSELIFVSRFYADYSV